MAELKQSGSISGRVDILGLDKMNNVLLAAREAVNIAGQALERANNSATLQQVNELIVGSLGTLETLIDDSGVICE